ncbi:unnamed protein product [Adineta ricciae]|uniref:G-protein coupled receptors family 1 profile domain-containing protein n=1 Tax=Adineta ricciae TaxID=249248 RepID=A0A814R8R1_ADIRI|nr:unnamed protein product [Adineta ricciae]CAF1413568.1 unnamed protein product [Adineta ricciae]
MINLVSRIVMSGDGIDLTRTSVSWCKIRNFSIATLSLLSLTCSCLATIDQYFATSQNVSLRRLSNIQLAHRILIVMIIVWFCHGIPFLVFYNISSTTNICASNNLSFAVYYPSVYFITLNCTIPVSIMVIFGYLAYRNIHSTRILAEQQADRQLVRMILIEALLILISYIQYGVHGTYMLMTSNMIKSSNRLNIEGFVSTMANLIYYLYFSGSCYMFLLSSSRFRQEAVKQLLFWRKQNRINPS